MMAIFIACNLAALKWHLKWPVERSDNWTTGIDLWRLSSLGYQYYRIQDIHTGYTCRIHTEDTHMYTGHIHMQYSMATRPASSLLPTWARQYSMATRPASSLLPIWAMQYSMATRPVSSLLPTWAMQYSMATRPASSLLPTWAMQYSMAIRPASSPLPTWAMQYSMATRPASSLLPTWAMQYSMATRPASSLLPTWAMQYSMATRPASSLLPTWAMQHSSQWPPGLESACNHQVPQWWQYLLPVIWQLWSDLIRGHLKWLVERSDNWTTTTGIDLWRLSLLGYQYCRIQDTHTEYTQIHRQDRHMVKYAHGVHMYDIHRQESC